MEEPTPSEPPDSSPDSLPPRTTARLFHPGFSSGRIAIAAAIGALATCLAPSNVPLRVRSVIGWDTAALVYCVTAWILIFRSTAAMTKKRAAFEDPGRRLVLGVALAASLFSLFAAVVVLREVKTMPGEQSTIWTGLALLAVALSWIVTHTAFTLRYAHLYYRKAGVTGCLQFPGKELPREIDFAYFAFTVGMCFQVSDVAVASTRARRVVLLHALISFVYNTTILALSMSFLASMVG